MDRDTVEAFRMAWQAISLAWELNKKLLFSHPDEIDLDKSLRVTKRAWDRAQRRRETLRKIEEGGKDE
jgi:hypothetical protein